MSYYSGKDILPEKLLVQIQKYIDGEYLYIPRKDSNRKQWGEVKNTKHKIAERNNEIYKKYLSGCSVIGLSEEYCLSDKTIYSIISKFKKH